MPFFSSVRGNLGATGRGIRKLGGLIPTWVTSAGSLGNTFDSLRESKSYSVSATATGETVTYSVTSASRVVSNITLQLLHQTCIQKGTQSNLRGQILPQNHQTQHGGHAQLHLALCATTSKPLAAWPISDWHEWL